MTRVLIVMVLMGSTAALAEGRTLRVCADPNNLPFSNERREGFENRIAELVAQELGATVEYVWWAQRRGFFRNTLKAKKCDVVMGVPLNLEMVLPTRSYYRSAYAFVSRADHKVRSFDDPALRKLRVGVQLVGDDGANTPPVTALARRGIVDNVVGYSVVADYSRPNPPAEIVEAVRRGDIDVAIAWGPMAGYFAGRGEPKLEISVVPVVAEPGAPFVFDIAMGVRHQDKALRDELNAIIAKRQKDIDAVLAEYHVPHAPRGSEK
jgi:mxaJ protein